MQQSYERCRRLGSESVTSSFEYTLSDYQGDVKRVLYSSVTVGEGARFANGDAVECSGVIECNIVYQDTEGRLTPVSFTGDYDLNVRCDGEACRDVNTHTRVANYNVRLMGPRRFSLKATVECEAVCSETAEYKIEGEEMPLETKTEKVKIEKIGFRRGEEVELAEEVVMLDGAIEDEVEVLVHRVEPRAVIYQKSESGGSVRCSLAVRALIAVKGNEPQNYETVIDLVSRLEGEDIADGCETVPSVGVLSSVITLNPSEAGVSVVASVIASGSAEIYENVSVELLDDCFSTERVLDVEVADFAYTEHLFARPIYEKINEREVKVEDGRRIRNLLYETARVKLGSISSDAKSVTACADLQISGISCEIDENGDVCYSPIKFDVPIEINVKECCHIPAKARYNCHLSYDSLRVEVNGGSLVVSCNISGYIAASVDKSCRAVSGISAADGVLSFDPSVISVYYPTPEESLFDVGRRFHVSVTRLAQINELTESVLASADNSGCLCGVKYLIIK